MHDLSTFVILCQGAFTVFLIVGESEYVVSPVIIVGVRVQQW